MKESEKMRKRIYEIIEKSDGQDNLSKIYDIFMICTIILSLIPLTFKTSNNVFNFIDKICLIIFVADYMLRLLTADYKFV